MNARPNLFTSKTAVVAVILGSALGLGLTWQQQLTTKRRHLMGLLAQQNEAAQRVNHADAMLQAVREELARERDKRLTTQVRVKAAEDDLTRPARDDAWADSPAASPRWVNASPYVWLSKKMLSGVATQPFTKAGELRKDFADALAVTETERQAVNKALTAVVTEFRALEAAQAERTLTPPKQPGDSDTITVRIPAMPDHSVRLMQQVEAALEAEVGAQRKDLLVSMARPGFDSELNGFGKRERKLSVKRHANGSLEIRRGDSMMSGMFQLADHVPAHLAHFFEELEHVRAEAVSQAP